jgi:tetratricopeptide (TPR) repeat protein
MKKTPEETFDGIASFDGELEEEDSPTPSLLTGEGVTLAQIEAFARAAVDFLAATSWQLLSGGDLVRIEAPDGIAPTLRHVVVMRLRQGLSLAFFQDEAAREAFRDDEPLDEQWILFLEPLWEIPLSDADLWQRHALPLCGEEELCPVPVLVRRGVTFRPDAWELAFFEGLLKALAASTEAEVDAGRWEREVETHLGRLRFVFSLPDLLALAASEEPPRRPALVLECLVERRRRFLAEWFGVSEEEVVALLESYQHPVGDPGVRDSDDPVNRLLDAAEILGGRRSVLLARRALALRPDCSQAYLLLAEAAPDPAQALELCDRARILAEQDLEPEREGVALDYVLRAHEGMARALCALDRLEEAVVHLRELLRLDPEDLFEARDRLACTLLLLGRDEEAAGLVEGSLEEGSTALVYTRALLAFRREGDALAARRALLEALRVNALVPGALLPRADLSLPESFIFADDDFDAAEYVKLAGTVWRRTPGALTWLVECLGALGSEEVPSQPL